MSVGPAARSGLNGVAVLSRRNAWAVGSSMAGGGEQTLVVHWNGTRWRRVPSPTPGGSASAARLWGVAALSRRDIWAVGQQGSDVTQTLAEHWNGHRWKVVPSPNPVGPPIHSELYAVAAVSHTSVWAVGCCSPGKSGTGALIEHWNGHGWKVTDTPSPPGSALFGLAAASATDVWAVGIYKPAGAKYFHTLTEHWNGHRWRLVPSPNPPKSFGSFLNAVTVRPSGRAWAVGFYLNNPDQPVDQTLVERWNGRRWKVVPSPNRPGGDNVLRGVTTLSRSGAWAVGGATAGGGDQGLVVRWNGHRWRLAPSPKFTRTKFATLSGVAGVSRTGFWAVGGGLVAVAARWNGSTWKVYLP
ncbi:MAG TPA: hypothetical protein VF933_12975 [Streptosporangiaceae bacterium]